MRYHKLLGFNIFIVLITTSAFYVVFWQNSLLQYGLILLTVIAFLFWALAQHELGDALTLLPRGKRLITSGIYKKVRHPIYIASMGVFVCLSLYTMNALILVITFALIILQTFRAAFEEKVLLKTFGNLYMEYKKNTWI